MGCKRWQEGKKGGIVRIKPIKKRASNRVYVQGWNLPLNNPKLYAQTMPTTPSNPTHFHLITLGVTQLIKNRVNI